MYLLFLSKSKEEIAFVGWSGGLLMGGDPCTSDLRAKLAASFNFSDFCPGQKWNQGKRASPRDG